MFGRCAGQGSTARGEPVRCFDAEEYDDDDDAFDALSAGGCLGVRVGFLCGGRRLLLGALDPT